MNHNRWPFSARLGPDGWQATQATQATIIAHRPSESLPSPSFWRPKFKIHPTMGYATFCRWPLPLVMLVMALFLQVHPCESHSKLEHVLLPSHAYPSGCLLLLGIQPFRQLGGCDF